MSLDDFEGICAFGKIVSHMNRTPFPERNMSIFFLRNINKLTYSQIEKEMGVSKSRAREINLCYERRVIYLIKRIMKRKYNESYFR